MRGIDPGRGTSLRSNPEGDSIDAAHELLDRGECHGVGRSSSLLGCEFVVDVVVVVDVVDVSAVDVVAAAVVVLLCLVVVDDIVGRPV